MGLANSVEMIHRKFLGMSVHDKCFAFTRRTCLAAAKTIIKEVKEEMSNDTPILWTFQAFIVAAATILSLDNFNRHRSARETSEHRRLVSETIDILSASVQVSSNATRGTRLLSDLLAEEHKEHTQMINHEESADKGKHRSDGYTSVFESHEYSLDVAEFFKKFCESDQASVDNSPISSNVALWLQDSSS